MVPYLKGIHQTLDSWRLGRNEDGWKLSCEELSDLSISGGYEISKEVEERAPVKVKAVSLHHNHLVAMKALLADEEPYCPFVRVEKNGWVGYGMSDVSGDGFGVAFFIDGLLLFRYGQ